MFNTTETSEPAVNVSRTSRGYAPLFEIHEHWAPSDRVEITSLKSAKQMLQIGAVFINKPQIWVLNNYILAWNTRIQCRQALAVAVRHVWCRHVLGTYREETKQPRRPIAGLPLLEFSPPWESRSDIYTCPAYCFIVPQTVFLFCFFIQFNSIQDYLWYNRCKATSEVNFNFSLSAISIFLSLGSSFHWTPSHPYHE